MEENRPISNIRAELQADVCKRIEDLAAKNKQTIEATVDKLIRAGLAVESEQTPPTCGGHPGELSRH